jgi:hypothetical protein
VAYPQEQVMKRRCVFVSGPVVLTLLLVTASVLADESAPNTEFTYTDDWAFVSAPPPPGPYRAVNIDPRVPGVDAIPPLPMDTMTAPNRNYIPAEAMANPPSAGIPATVPPQDRPAYAVETQRIAPHTRPGQRERMAPSPPGRYNPAPSRYPAQSYSAPTGGYTGYRNQPAYGYYGSPAYPQEQQVPPPPVYDALIRNQPPTGRGTP